MKKIGMIGGMGWASTVSYYAELNRLIQEKLGGHHSAEIILYSVDFDPIERMQRAGDWPKMGEALGKAASALQAAGADFAILCTNTMHKVFDEMRAHAKGLNFLHIGDVTARAIIERGLQKILLLGTRYTMEQDFLIDRLKSHGLSIMTPEENDRSRVNSIIFDELTLDIRNEDSRNAIIDIIQKSREAGAQGVILGCTELGLLVSDQNSPIPAFDTALIHARGTAAYALAP